MTDHAQQRPRVAIVGGGIAGIGAGLALQDVCDTELFEAGRLGGHLLPAATPGPDGASTTVDTGFVVFVPETYPRVTELLQALGVEHAPARTQFRITDDIRGLSFEPGDMLKMCGREIPRACRRDLLQIHQSLGRIRQEGLDWIDNCSMAEFVANQGWQPESIALSVLPWVASFWGLQPRTVLEVSARAAMREIARNAGPLQMHRVVPSTGAYLEAVTTALSHTRVRPDEVVRVVASANAQPTVTTASESLTYDHVVLAVAADDAAKILVADDPKLRQTLARFRYNATVAILHHDVGLLPSSQGHWRTFHHRRMRAAQGERSVTTWVLDLLHDWVSDPATIATPTLLSTGDPGLLDESVVDPNATRTVFRHRHLVMTPDVVDAMATLRTLESRAEAPGCGRVLLAGSYRSLGALHEDALCSGLRAAAQIRARAGLPPAREPFDHRPSDRGAA